MLYIHQQDDWPRFRWDPVILAQILAGVRHHQGRLTGRMEMLGFKLREEAVLRTLTQDVIKSSEIEGEELDPDQVRSSIARRLGMDVGGLVASDRNVEGVVEMMLDATQRFDQPLTRERLFGWHAALFPTGRSGMNKITVGGWRDDQTGPMEVVSGPIGRERVHFQAPSAERLDAEMAAFLDWFNAPPAYDPVIKAAIAHLWFVTIHPFDDGNGRIARAIADMALARSDGSAQRFYSMSARIRVERGAYYDILEATQKAGLDVTRWLDWFLGCLERAFAGADETLSAVLTKAAFWERFSPAGLNARQVKVLNRLLDGFDGNLTNAKYATLAKTSSDTALRDLNDLVERGVLDKAPAGGRGTRYMLNQPAQA
jgi:Fic family protein